MAEVHQTTTVEEAANRSTAPTVSTWERVLSGIASTGNSVLSLLSSLLAAFLILYSGYVLYDTFYTQDQAFTSAVELVEKYRPGIIEDIENDDVPLASGGASLSAVTDDYRAWLTIYDSRIDYPVLQGYDDVYYAVHDTYGNTSLTGSIYMAAASSPDMSDTYNIIYGHHMENGAMFGALDEFRGAAYFNSHKTGVLVSDSGVYDLYVFAVLDTDAYEGMVYTVGNRDIPGIVNYLRGSAVQFDEASASQATRIVALSTCADATTDGRLVVFARMVPRTYEIIANGYTNAYDGQQHTLSLELRTSDGRNIMDSSTIEYWTEGTGWTTEKPVIKNVGEVEVRIRVSNTVYGGTHEETVTLHVDPLRVTVAAVADQKVYLDTDPAFAVELINDATGEVIARGVSVDGVGTLRTLWGDVIAYTISRPRVGQDENVNTYSGAIIPTGERTQGNYIVSYRPADFEITNGTLALRAEGYTGVYDANAHEATVRPTVRNGTTISYSLDGGRTWTVASTDGGVTWINRLPSITNVGEQSVVIRATNPNYATVQQTVTLRVTPAPVTVTANPANRTDGEDDPVFTARVTGVIDGFQIVYTVTRPNADNETEPGIYPDSIVPAGAQLQGNYIVTYVPAQFQITAAATEEIEDVQPPLAQFVNQFQPTGGSHGTRAWALVNLICVLVTAYLFLPLLHLREKLGRPKTMRSFNEAKEELRERTDLTVEEEAERRRIDQTALDERARRDDPRLGEVTVEEFRAAVEKLYYPLQHFLRRFRTGLGLELIDTIAAIVAFILTEDMRLPVVLIDRWTPLMLLLLAVCWVADVRLLRYHEEEPEEERETATV
ncbi:MAG: sortase [Oscillospiraceae bacterium]|nr:sortase [Oscillospiraceae bacterium]